MSSVHMRFFPESKHLLTSSSPHVQLLFSVGSSPVAARASLSLCETFSRGPWSGIRSEERLPAKGRLKTQTLQQQRGVFFFLVRFRSGSRGSQAYRSVNYLGCAGNNVQPLELTRHPSLAAWIKVENNGPLCQFSLAIVCPN